MSGLCPQTHKDVWPEVWAWWPGPEVVLGMAAWLRFTQPHSASGSQSSRPSPERPQPLDLVFVRGGPRAKQNQTRFLS